MWRTDMQEVFQQIANHIQIEPTEIIIEKILHGNREKQNVHQLRIRDKRYLLKQHENAEPVTKAGMTPFQIEKFTLSSLHSGGCAVPQLIWDSEKHQTLLLEWVGDETLDSLAQNSSIPNLTPLLHRIMRQLCHIESHFIENRTQFLLSVFQFDAHSILQSLLDQGRKTVGYLAHLQKNPLTSSQLEHLDSAWNNLSNNLLNAPTTLDTLDYQANNIVINGEEPYLIDFASVGWDWQERRLVQHFTSIGAFQEDGNFISLLNHELIRTYSEWVVLNREKCTTTEVAARVDGHHLLFYLTIIHKILHAQTRPESPESQLLVDAWGDMRLRIQRAISLIITTSLSDDVYINQIRNMIAEFCIDIS